LAYGIAVDPRPHGSDRLAIIAAPATFIARRYKRCAAFRLLHYWGEPIDRMDLQKKAMRLLIEHVC
jgi:hypothetical protein